VAQRPPFARLGAGGSERRALSGPRIGEGSIYRRKSDGKWCGSFGPRGGRRVVYGKTKSEVREKLFAMQVEMQRKHLRTDRVPTLAEFLEYWLAQSVKPRLRPLTFAGYTVNVRKHIVPALGTIRLDRLTPQNVQEMMNQRLATGFSAKTVRYVHQVLRTALSVARRWELVDRNVATLVDPPRATRTQIYPLDPNEARRFLESVRGDRLEALYSVALALGLRQGEALGLRWHDIDLNVGVLRVQHQLQRIDTKLTLVEPKTERSRRTLVLPASIAAGLREHEKRQLAEKLWAGSKWVENGLVFTNLVGGPLQARKVIRDFHKALDKAGLRSIRFHDLRHSCATLLLVQGVSPRVVMDILGHSEIAMTMDTYSHVIPELQREAAAKMESVLSIPTKSERER
jgi:integrase